MPTPSRRAAAGVWRTRARPPISTRPSSGATEPLAIPSNVDFPDPFSPTRAWTSPARQSTLTPLSACTAPNAFDTPRTDRTWGSSGPGIDVVISSCASLLWIHLVEQAERDERRARCRRRIALEAHVAGRLVLELNREDDRRRDLRSGELHHVRGQRDADLGVAGGVVEDLQLRILQLVGEATHARLVRPVREDALVGDVRCLVRGVAALRHEQRVLVADAL